MHIVPLITGEERAALRFCQQALDLGVFAQAILPPRSPAAPRGCASPRWPPTGPGELRTPPRPSARQPGAPGSSRGRSGSPPEPAEELAEIETALVRAERLAAPAEQDEPGGASGDRERRAAASGVLFDQHASGEPAAPEPAAGTEIELALEQAEGGAPAELFDFERAA